MLIDWVWMIFIIIFAASHAPCGKSASFSFVEIKINEVLSLASFVCIKITVGTCCTIIVRWNWSRVWNAPGIFDTKFTATVTEVFLLIIIALIKSIIVTSRDGRSCIILSKHWMMNVESNCFLAVGTANKLNALFTSHIFFSRDHKVLAVRFALVAIFGLHTNKCSCY